MDAALQELEQHAKACELAAEAFEKEPIAAMFVKLRKAVKSVAESWSRSWMGYQANVYYAEFKVPAPGDQFSPEWGLNKPFSHQSQSWRQVRDEDVEAEVFRRSGVQDLRLLESVAQDSERAFGVAKENVIPTLDALLTGGPDPTLADLRKEISNAECHLGQSDIIKVLRPNRLASRDVTAVLQGLSVPPHIAFDARLTELESHKVGVSEIAKLMRRALRYLQKKQQVIQAPGPVAARGVPASSPSAILFSAPSGVMIPHKGADLLETIIGEMCSSIAPIPTNRLRADYPTRRDDVKALAEEQYLKDYQSEIFPTLQGLLVTSHASRVVPIVDKVVAGLEALFRKEADRMWARQDLVSMTGLTDAEVRLGLFMFSDAWGWYGSRSNSINDIQSFKVSENILSAKNVANIIEHARLESLWRVDREASMGDRDYGLGGFGDAIRGALQGATVLLRATESGKPQGSGFLVIGSNVIVTCRHVVGTADRMRVQFRDDPGVYEGQVVRKWKDSDLAALIFAKPFVNKKGIRVSSAKAFAEGNDVWVAGYPNPDKFGDIPTVSKGHISGVDAEYDGDSGLIKLSGCACSPGMSGGPVILHETGTVIGVMTLKALKTDAANLMFATPVIGVLAELGT